jgi:hypothetical protein
LGETEECATGAATLPCLIQINPLSRQEDWRYRSGLAATAVCTRRTGRGITMVLAHPPLPESPGMSWITAIVPVSPKGVAAPAPAPVPAPAAAAVPAAAAAPVAAAAPEAVAAPASTQ